MNVFHTGPLPTNTRSIPLKHWVHVEGEPTRDGIIMGMFKDEDDVDYIMFVNRDYRNEQYISVEFKNRVDKLEVLDKKTGEWLDNRVRGYNTIIPQIWAIPPGDGILVKVQRSW